MRVRRAISARPPVFVMSGSQFGTAAFGRTIVDRKITAVDGASEYHAVDVAGALQRFIILHHVVQDAVRITLQRTAVAAAA